MTASDIIKILQLQKRGGYPATAVPMEVDVARGAKAKAKRRAKESRKAKGKTTATGKASRSREQREVLKRRKVQRKGQKAKTAKAGTTDPRVTIVGRKVTLPENVGVRGAPNKFKPQMTTSPLPVRVRHRFPGAHCGGQTDDASEPTRRLEDRCVSSME